MEILATILLCGWLCSDSPASSSAKVNYGDGKPHLYQTYEKKYYEKDYSEPKRKWFWKK